MIKMAPVTPPRPDVVWTFAVVQKLMVTLEASAVPVVAPVLVADRPWC